MRKQIISLDISVIDYNQALNEVLELGRKQQPSYSCFANAHMVTEAHRSAVFKNQVNQSNYTFADGMPLVFALKRLHGLQQSRIAGMDFMKDAIRLCEQQKLSVYFLGSTEDTLHQLQVKLKNEFPELIIAGRYSPPFRKWTEGDNNLFAEQTNNSGANVVFVSLGCPKQEAWMAEHYQKIKATLLGVGAAFPVLAGITGRAPRWMQRASLEWVYRLGQEPRRLFKRYAVTNTLFVYYLIVQFFAVKQKNNPKALPNNNNG